MNFFFSFFKFLNDDLETPLLFLKRSYLSFTLYGASDYTMIFKLQMEKNE